MAAQRIGASLAALRSRRLFVLGLSFVLVVLGWISILGELESLGAEEVAPATHPGRAVAPWGGGGDGGGGQLTVVASTPPSLTGPIQSRGRSVLDPMLEDRMNNLSVVQMPYLLNYRSPCWEENVTTEYPYAPNHYRHHGGRNYLYYFLHRAVKMKAKFLRGERQLRCLPLVYQIGFVKCGTTDLYQILTNHPWLRAGAYKEPHFWNKIHFQGLAGNPNVSNALLRDYVDLYDQAADVINKTVTPGQEGYHPAITIDASVFYAHEFTYWDLVPANRGLDEPKVFTAHYIRELVPGAKIIAIVREPVDRLYSEFHYFQAASSYTRHELNTSAAYFHQVAQRAVGVMMRCLSRHALRYCAYHRQQYGDRMDPLHSGKNVLDLGAGIYYPFLRDWFAVFPHNAILVLRLEDHKRDRIKTSDEIFRFLRLPPHNVTVPPQPANRGPDREAMWPETRQLLQRFYKPFNRMLADFMGDQRYDYR